MKLPKGVFYKGYLSKKGKDYFTKKAVKKLEKEGYLKNGKLKVRFGSTPYSLKKGDYVITFEIHRLLGKFKEGEKGEFECASFLPICSTKWCNEEGECGHACIKHVGLGQQGIAKLLKR